MSRLKSVLFLALWSVMFAYLFVVLRDEYRKTKDLAAKEAVSQAAPASPSATQVGLETKVHELVAKVKELELQRDKAIRTSRDLAVKNADLASANTSLTSEAREALAKAESMEHELAPLKQEHAKTLADEFLKSSEAKTLGPQEKEVIVETIKSLGEIPILNELKPLADVQITIGNWTADWNQRWSHSGGLGEPISEESRKLLAEKKIRLEQWETSLQNLLGVERAKLIHK